MLLSANKFRRKIEDVHLIAVTKTHPFQSIISAHKNNIFIIGENKVQEATHKLSNEVIPKNIEIHLIGHLQSNKINKAISIFDVIQTVDSLSLAHKINTACKKINKLQRVYIQINTGEDSLKHGFHINEVLDVAKEPDCEESEFIKVESFQGRKEGMVFKTGSWGLGYYPDVAIVEDKLEVIKNIEI